MKILILAPLHDIATIISSNAVLKLKDWIRKRNKELVGRKREPIDFTVLRGFVANRMNLWFYRNTDAIFYYGHGLKDRLGDIGIRVIPIIDKKNCHWFKDSIIYTMSCYSGKELSKFCIEKGVKAYFGQTTQYFGFAPSISNKHLNDWYDLVNKIPISLMLGDSCGEALRKYEAFANELKTKYLNQPPTINSKLLFSNALNMELYGDISAELP